MESNVVVLLAGVSGKGTAADATTGGSSSTTAAGLDNDKASSSALFPSPPIPNSSISIDAIDEPIDAESSETFLALGFRLFLADASRFDATAAGIIDPEARSCTNGHSSPFLHPFGVLKNEQAVLLLLALADRKEPLEDICSTASPVASVAFAGDPFAAGIRLRRG
jgi:hypothetical protein